MRLTWRRGEEEDRSDGNSLQTSHESTAAAHPHSSPTPRYKLPSVRQASQVTTGSITTEAEAESSISCSSQQYGGQLPKYHTSPTPRYNSPPDSEASGYNTDSAGPFTTYPVVQTPTVREAIQDTARKAEAKSSTHPTPHSNFPAASSLDITHLLPQSPSNQAGKPKHNTGNVKAAIISYLMVKAPSSQESMRQPVPSPSSYPTVHAPLGRACRPGHNGKSRSQILQSLDPLANLANSQGGGLQLLQATWREKISGCAEIQTGQALMIDFRNIHT